MSRKNKPFTVIVPEWEELRFSYNGSHTVEVLYVETEVPLDAFTLYPDGDRLPTHAEVLAAIFERAEEAAE